jgi:hypothetical protein
VAISNYKLEFGCYPWPADDGKSASPAIDMKSVAAELCGTSEAKKNRKTNYLGNVSSGQIVNGEIVDPWGNPIQLRIKITTYRPLMWSFGPNGKDDTNDGVAPASGKKPKSYYLYQKGLRGDDIQYW